MTVITRNPYIKGGLNNIKYSEDWVGTVGRMMNDFKYPLPSSNICCKITNEIYLNAQLLRDLKEF